MRMAWTVSGRLMCNGIDAHFCGIDRVSLRSLSTYRKKRDFDKTAEPSGDIPVAPSRQRRVVIQKHAASRLPYDLRVELGGGFKTCAGTKGPSRDHARYVPAGG